MLFVKRYLVLGIIKKIVTAVAKIIYKILSLFHLEFTLLCVVLGCVLEIANGTVSKSKTSLIVFHVILASTVVYAFLRTLGIGKRPKSEKKERKEKQTAPDEKQTKQIEEVERSFNEKIVENAIEKTEEQPKYFRVKQNPKYVMAEYTDRYELFLDTGSGYEYVRTDYKGE